MTAAVDELGGAQVLDAVHAFLARFVVYPSSHAHTAHTLWVAHAWLMSAWDSTPRIAFLSPEPASGKSRALEVTELLVPRPVIAINCTPAYLFRKVSDPDGSPTILYDEIDTVFGPAAAKDNEDVRGMLNAGHRKGATAGRCVIRGKIIDTEELPAYCAVAFAGLGDLPETITSRSVVIRMRRRAPDEDVEPFRHRDAKPEGDYLAEQLADWAGAIGHLVGDPWPKLPDGVVDRDADVWEALVAVAELAGGRWPDLARAACVAFVTGARDNTVSRGIQLLHDIYAVWDSWETSETSETLQVSAFPIGPSVSHLSETLLVKLRKLDESPWGDQKRPLNARGLAALLKKYGIRSKQVRVGDLTGKGYRRDDFADAWKRYPPPAAECFPSMGNIDDKGNALTSDVSLVSHVSQEPQGRCAVCGGKLSAVLVGLDMDTHPMCEPAEPSSATELAELLP